MGINLVTLAEYKAYKGIASDTQDTAINAIIPKVSELVKTLCRRTFVDYVNDFKIEVSSGGVGSKLFLKEYPVLSVSSVELSIDYGNTYVDLTEFVDYVLDVEDDTIVSLSNSGVFPKYINGYRITYTGGYEVIPADLKLAVLDLVSYYLRNDAAIHSNKAPGTNTVQIEYVTNTSLPSHIKRVLDLYTGSFD